MLGINFLRGAECSRPREAECCVESQSRCSGRGSRGTQDATDKAVKDKTELESRLAVVEHAADAAERGEAILKAHLSNELRADKLKTEISGARQSTTADKDAISALEKAAQAQVK